MKKKVLDIEKISLNMEKNAIKDINSTSTRENSSISWA